MTPTPVPSPARLGLESPAAPSAPVPAPAPVQAPAPVPSATPRRPRLATLHAPPADPIESLAREVATAADCDGPLLVTVERGGAQISATFTVMDARAPLDLFALDAIVRRRGAVVVSASSRGGELKATLMLERAVAQGAPARPRLLGSAWVLLARAFTRPR